MGTEDRGKRDVGEETIRDSSELDDDSELSDTQVNSTLPEAHAAAIARDASSGARTREPTKSSPVRPPSASSSSPMRGPSSSVSAVREAAGSRASVPPSEPRGSRTSFSQIDLGSDRPARLQMIVALLLGLVLVAIPLYLWRRPKAEPIPVATNTDAGAAAVDTSAASSAEGDAKPTLGEARNLSCQDPGPKKTSPSECDHVVEVEKALAKAIEESASCVTKDAGGGTIVYVADVSFKKKSLSVLTPKEGRTLKSSKAVSACQSAVRAKLGSLALDGTNHTHARYKIAITATYPGATK